HRHAAARAAERAGAHAPRRSPGGRACGRNCRRLARPDLALDARRGTGDARSRESGRPIVPQLARPRIRGPGKHRSGLPADQQELQPLVLGQRSLAPTRVGKRGVGERAWYGESVIVHVLACDYDGTIADDGRVTRDTAAVLARVRESGRKLFLVTG